MLPTKTQLEHVLSEAGATSLSFVAYGEKPVEESWHFCRFDYRGARWRIATSAKRDHLRLFAEWGRGNYFVDIDVSPGTFFLLDGCIETLCAMIPTKVRLDPKPSPPAHPARPGCCSLGPPRDRRAEILARVRQCCRGLAAVIDMRVEPLPTAAGFRIELMGLLGSTARDVGYNVNEYDVSKACREMIIALAARAAPPARGIEGAKPEHTTIDEPAGIDFLSLYTPQGKVDVFASPYVPKGAVIRPPSDPHAMYLHPTAWKALQADLAALAPKQPEPPLFNIDKQPYEPIGRELDRRATERYLRPETNPPYVSEATQYLKIEPPRGCESCGNVMLKHERYTCGFCKHVHPMVRKA